MSSCRYRVRLVMERLPGEPLGAVLERPKSLSSTGFWQEFKQAWRRAYRMVWQLAPTFATLGIYFFHRDVSASNILQSVEVDSSLGLRGAGAQTGDVAGDPFPETKANFWLIDFGLAVPTGKWAGLSSMDAVCWKHNQVGTIEHGCDLLEAQSGRDYRAWMRSVGSTIRYRAWRRSVGSTIR